MKAALALAVLTASTVALAQQTTPPSPAEPRTSATPQEQTAPPAESTAPRMSETDKQILLRDCTRQVEASHPTVPEKDVKSYCEQEVKTYSTPH
jgi:hypothetical protein